MQVADLPDGGAGERQQLVSSARTLGIGLTEPQARQLQQLLDELARWNRAYNLTALEHRADWLTHHLLDSLSVAPWLAGTRIADVGTGPGFPGLPLAVLRPDCHFTLIDSNGKKIRFVEHAVRTLGLANVTPRQARAESLRESPPYDTVLARAFAALPELLAAVRGLCGPSTRVLAMKGRRPDAELAAIDTARWRVDEIVRLEVPGLGAERHLVRLSL
jgi:16S rRNA (guanine527-N7)-methyltransferase